MTPLHIRAIDLHAPPVQADDGSLIFAHFNVEYGPLLVVGCTLVQWQGEAMRVRLPGVGRGRRVVMRDRADRDTLLRTALSAYEALAGHSADSPLATVSPIMESQS